MKPTLKPGLKHALSFKVPRNKTVPYLYPEAANLQAMPEVFGGMPRSRTIRLP